MQVVLMMATPIRKKRNFKALVLDVLPPSEPEIPPVKEIPPATKGKKRPPPLDAPKKGPVPLANDSYGLLNGVASPSPTERSNAYHAALSSTLAKLDKNAETRFDVRNEDLKDLQELGQGNGGSVKKVEHMPTKTIMAKKVNDRCLSVVVAD